MVKQYNSHNIDGLNYLHEDTDAFNVLLNIFNG